MKITRSYYLRDNVIEVARNLVGKILVTNIDNVICSGIIVETEAYHESERACHAYNGRKTRRTETLFEEGGICYVYLCYGIHHLFNVVTGPENSGQAVLIRAIEPRKNFEIMEFRYGRTSGRTKYLTNGPGKLTRAMGINTSMNKTCLSDNQIWIEDKGINGIEIGAGKRIGVDYAGKDALLPWRFFIKGNPYVSK